MKEIELFIELLEEINTKYSIYINILLLERKYLIENNMELFSKNLNEKVNISIEIEKLDEKISEVMEKITLNSEIKSLKELSETIDDEEIKSEFLYLKDKLKNTMEKVTKENKINEKILSEKNEFIKTVLQKFKSNDNIYSRKGKNKPINSKGFIDRKV